MSLNLKRSITDELAKRWYQRSDPALLRLHHDRQAVAQRHDTRVAAWAVALLYTLFAITDALLIEDVLTAMIVARLTIAVLFVVILEIQFRNGTPLAIIEVQCAFAVVGGYVTWLALSSLSAYHLNLSYYITFGTIFMMVTNLLFNFGFWLSAISSGFVVVGFFLAIASVIPLGRDYAIVIGTLYTSSYVLTLFVNWKLNQERYRVSLNAFDAEIGQREADERGAALLRLSTTDALTGLANRRATDEELRTLWDEWQTRRESFAVVLIDVDYFKRFNDHFGHQEGDRCLMAVADAMARVSAAHAAMLGRFGGEEFILLLRCREKAAVAAIAEDLRQAVEDLGILHDQRPDRARTITVSVGAAFSADIADGKVERLITEADRALYSAKAGDRNCVRVFDKADPERLDEDETVAALLKTAIEQDRVALVYQPIRCARTDAVVAAEALMRLKTQSGKFVSPAVFIPIAEQSGTIVDLGTWAIRQACREMIATDLVEIVSVNLSAVQLKMPGFPLTVAAILGETGVNPRRLALEITEGREIESQPEILKTIGELKALGVQIWLDDFGTGFAGLSCIREIAFDMVKVDRSFLHASHTPRGAAMLRDIIDLINNAGHATLIEGVESKEQLAFLGRFAVDLFQGFHLGRPMQPDAFERVVRGDAKLEAPGARRLG